MFSFLKHTKSAHLRPVLLTCFFVSGACGLIYQVAWLRVMGLVFGNTTLATCTVLAGYMAGLGLGALYFGRRADRGLNSVLAYARLELGVALYAFVTPFLWKIIEWLSVSFYRAVEPDFWTLSAFRFTLAFAALFLPTFFMGGTLPIITKYFVERRQDTGRDVGRLYALNTFGAVAGVYLSGFYMLYTLGVWQSAVLAGVLNLIIFFICRAYSVWGQPRAGQNPQIVETAGPPQTVEQGRGPWFSAILLILFALSGGISMVYEIGWTRILAVSLGSSVYAFSIMLATFLLGIALGSMLFSFYSKKFPVTLPVFAGLEILTAIFVFAGLNQFDNLSYQFVQFYEWAHGRQLLLDLGRFLLCAWVMLPPTLCIGALFACFIHIYQHFGRLGSDVGKAYFANTIGTIGGSVLTGFWLIPALGIQKTLLAGAWLNVLIGAAAFLIAFRHFSLRVFVSAVLLVLAASLSSWAVEPWNKTVLSSDTAVNPSRVKGLSREQFLSSMRERELVFYKEGSSATVSVTRLRDDLSLAVNGKTDASTNDAFTQFLLGHLPLFVHPDARKVMVIGVGSASTLAAVASHPVDEIHAVELEEAVVEAAKLFYSLNRNVLEDPRVRLFHNDGRNILLLRPERYDVIISEPSNPWMAGVANLFSYEHYQTTKKRLKPGGVACQWLHAYSMSTQDLQMIIKTFARVFPNTSLWTSYYPDLMLVGSESPLKFDFEKVKEVYARPHVAEDLAPHGIDSPESFFANYWLGTKEIWRLSQGGKTNTDNYPILEFSAPRHLYSKTLVSNFKFLNRYRTRELPEIVRLEPPADQNGLFYLELAQAYMAKRFMKEAQQALARAAAAQPGMEGQAIAAAELLMANNKWAEARLSLEKSASLRPQDGWVQFLLGKIAKEQKDLNRAYLHLHKAVLLEPENAEYLRSYFGVVCLRGDVAEAGVVFEKLKSMEADDFEIMAQFASLLFQKGPEPAQAVIAALMIERYPRFAQAYMRLGDLYEKAGSYWDALKVYRQMTEALPYEPQAHLRRALAAKNLQQDDESNHALKKALELDPSLKENPAIRAGFDL